VLRIKLPKKGVGVREGRKKEKKSRFGRGKSRKRGTVAIDLVGACQNLLGGETDW